MALTPQPDNAAAIATSSKTAILRRGIDFLSLACGSILSREAPFGFIRNGSQLNRSGPLKFRDRLQRLLEDVELLDRRHVRDEEGELRRFSGRHRAAGKTQRVLRLVVALQIGERAGGERAGDHGVLREAQPILVGTVA